MNKPVNIGPDALMVTSEPVNLTDEERKILGMVLAQGVDMRLKIPPEAPEDELWRFLEACSRGLSYMTQRALMLRPIIGRILLMYQRTPSHYKGRGFQYFQDFLSHLRELHGWSKTFAYDAMVLARDWPDLPPAEFAAIGPRKMNIIKTFAKGKDHNVAVVLDRAKSSTIKGFGDWAVETGRMESGEDTREVFEIHSTKAACRRFRKFFQDLHVHKHVDSADWGQILIALIEECHLWTEPTADFQQLEAEEDDTPLAAAVSNQSE